MKKKLLAVGVAATLGALAGVSSAAIWGPGPGHGGSALNLRRLR